MLQSIKKKYANYQTKNKNDEFPQTFGTPLCTRDIYGNAVASMVLTISLIFISTSFVFRLFRTVPNTLPRYFGSRIRVMVRL